MNPLETLDEVVMRNASPLYTHFYGSTCDTYRCSYCHKPIIISRNDRKLATLCCNSAEEKLRSE